MQRLRREIRVWLKLDHPNVLPLFGTITGFGQFPAMICPWFANGALTTYLERCNDKLTTEQRLLLIGDIAAGLQHLHSRSVVHGDLSGSNVLIRGDGRASIADFGLSTLLTELGGSTFATSCQARGTLRWAAPELLDLHVSDDEENPPKFVPMTQSDVYSFGGIMLQVMTGNMPYHYYMREVQVMRAILTGETPRRPSCDLMSDRRWSFIQRCWSSDDAGRKRPSSEELVEFTRRELVEALWPQS
ncbi:kinase-like domain-containing protein [Melanogaster broomeanus]|nr:kinase-like domain-containing protein [Melanogaster broomeanus]